MSLALLVVVLLMGSTGGAVAGALITGKQIKDGTVSTVDVRNESLTGVDVRNETVTGADVRNGTLTGADIFDEARMWGVTGTEPVVPVTANDNGTVIASKQFTSPAGFVHLTGAAYAEDDGQIESDVLGGVVIMLAIDDQVIDAGHVLLPETEGGGDSTSISVVVRVAAGAHNVRLLAFEVGTGSVVYTRELTIVYASTGSTNVTFLKERDVASRLAHR